jgi:anaerobic magnesium-protoporphyrin IX monomethyl ester cyclase
LLWRECPGYTRKTGTNQLRILIVNPSLRRGSGTKFLPVGVASVMTYLQSVGYDFDLLDVDIDDLSDDDIEAHLTDNRYDVVMAGSIVTHYKWMKWLTRAVKRHQPAAKVVIGNSVAGSLPEVFLKNSSADVAVIGEGEISAYEVLEAFRKGVDLKDVSGIAYVNGTGSVVKNPRRKAHKKIDEFPIIDWGRFNVAKYFERSYAGAEGLVSDHVPRVMPVVAARGCVFKCTFCHYVFWDDPYRYRSPQNVLTEIRRDIEVYGANYINFWDDLSFASLTQAERLADAIIASGLKFNWNAAVRVDLFGNPKHPYGRRVEVAEKFKAAGCLNLGFSLESGNQEILDMMEKRIEPQYFFEQIRILRGAGITCSTSVVFGYPIETAETIRQTFAQCLEAGVYPSIGFLLPLPYTAMYRYAKEHGFIDEDDAFLDSITERQDLCLNMTTLSDEEVMGLIKEGAANLNRMLELGLSADRLIKTGGYRHHTKETARSSRPLLDPGNLKRNQNDVSFNYGQATFTSELGVRGSVDAGEEADSRGKLRERSDLQ